MKASWILILLLGVFSWISADEDARNIDHKGSNHVRQKREVAGTTLRVTGIAATPYMMHRENATSVNTIGDYEGFIPDLLNLITDRTHIKFDLYMVPDSRYGAQYPNGTWTGMVGEIIKRTVDPTGDGADLAAAPLTITSVREEYIDFINPFQHLGLSIIYKRPQRTSYFDAPITFQILSPLSPGVWLMILGAFLLVSLLLWLINRFNPYEWRGQYERGRATQEQSEYLNISGAMWFTFTTLHWQGYESSPRSFGSRVLAGFWFMFVTITLVTYTGSLINNLFWASTMGAPRNPEPFKDLAGLVRNSDYKYGCVNGGSTHRFLKQNNLGGAYGEVRKTLLGPKGSLYLVNTTIAGLARVMKERYAFIGESTTFRHLVSKNCDLAMTHNLFAKRAFGMAIRNNTDEDVREALHGAILELMEEGDIEALEEEWFDSGLCHTDEPAQTPSSLFLNRPAVVNVKMFSGPMVILLVGMILSFGVTIAETIYFKLRGRFQSGNQPRGDKLHEEEVE